MMSLHSSLVSVQAGKGYLTLAEIVECKSVQAYEGEECLPFILEPQAIVAF